MRMLLFVALTSAAFAAEPAAYKYWSAAELQEYV
jgi:hypothetical protein